MKMTKMMIISGALAVFISCTREQVVDLDKSLDLDIKLDSKQLNESQPNFLTLVVENISDRSVRVPEKEMVLEFTSYSGSVRRVIPLRELSNDMSELENIVGLKLEPGEVKSIEFELGEIVYRELSNSGKSLPSDDYTVNIFMANSKNLQKIRYAENLRSNYVDVYIYN